MGIVTGVQSFLVSDFKSYHEAKLFLSPLTLLIGANASGKSNLIESLRLLSWLGRGKRLDEIMRGIQDQDLSVRGPLEDLVYRQSGSFGLGCTLKEEVEGDYWSVWIRLSVTGSGLRIAEEKVVGLGRAWLYRLAHPAKGFTNDVQVSYNNFARGRNKPRVQCTDQQLILTQLSTPAPFLAAHNKAREMIPRICGIFRESLSNMLFLDPSPSLMRGYSSVVDKVLSENGSNLSSVLYSLTEKGHKNDILAFIRALPEQDIVDISFSHTQRNEVMVRLVESFAAKNEERDAPVLSDGTLRVLAIAAALLSAKQGGLVLIEEIDNGVHPSRAGLLLQNILRVSRERQFSVLVTTHNPALLDALPTEAIPNVTCCYRDPNEGDSRLIRVQDMPSSAELLAQGPLGALMTKGILDRFLKDTRKPEQKIRESLEWLDKQEAKP